MCIQSNEMVSQITRSKAQHMLYNEIVIDSVIWSQDVSSLVVVPLQHASEYVQRDGARLQHQYGFLSIGQTRSFGRCTFLCQVLVLHTFKNARTLVNVSILNYELKEREADFVSVRRYLTRYSREATVTEMGDTLSVALAKTEDIMTHLTISTNK